MIIGHYVCVGTINHLIHFEVDRTPAFLYTYNALTGTSLSNIDVVMKFPLLF
jgi:hypothetical protein